ncbi:MAG: imidazole glycerol phosphate synthase subunit HisH [Clostridia bacterium]|nr:imidazole glycerol phosphate synthase subunit HisH [Clostridia bacterium]
MVCIVDYGVGNLFSLKCSFEAVGQETVITSDAEVIANAERLVLPGVGAFGDAAQKLRDSGLDKVVTEYARTGKPLLGICLGMQLLFDKSYEYGEHDGLGLIPGSIVPFKGRVHEGLKIPQMGWNRLNINGGKSPVFKYINDGDFVYFVHSYFAETESKYVAAYTDYGMDVTAAAHNKNVYGCQFHPEKSGKVGLAILKAFCEL